MIMGSAVKPIELLRRELKIFQRALELSNKHFEDGKIDKEKHDTHVKNLTVLITDYKFAIRTLERYGND